MNVRLNLDSSDNFEQDFRIDRRNRYLAASVALVLAAGALLGIVYFFGNLSSVGF